MQTKDIGAYILYSDGRIFKKAKSAFMKGAENSDGYNHVSLYGKLHKRHRVIIDAFKPKPPSDLHRPQVNHING